MRMLVGVMLAAVLGVGAASASSLSVLYSFCGVANCTNGEGPSGPLIRDGAGNLYGTVTSGGAAGGGGGVFRLSPDGNGGWTEKMIYSLCTPEGCPDGAIPDSGVIMDTDGNLYGTASSFGILGGGTVFELIPNANRTKWKIKMLLRFCSDGTCENGYQPHGLTYAGQAAGAPYDGTSPLYGITARGGANDGGVAFSLTPPAPGKKKWKQKIIHDFCPNNGCTSDGSDPEAGMVMDAAGNLYGTTKLGGNGGSSGVVFQLAPKGRGWKEKLLYRFCQMPACADGNQPRAPLVMDAMGALFGAAGGSGEGGVLFKLVPKHANYSVLYNFCAQLNCADGSGSVQGLTLGPSGELSGVSFTGGDATAQGGVIFTLDPTFEVLHTFCSTPSCPDGKYPSAPLLSGPDGSFFGTTLQGGDHSAGEVFLLTP